MIVPSGPRREPAVAGAFYPSDPEELARQIDELLAAAECPLDPDRELKAILCPHAGYPYSGFVAAEAFSCLKGRDYQTVVLVGPDHYIGFEGIAVYPEGSFRTPLGEVPIDTELAGLLLEAGNGVKAAPEAHRREHALEVQIPFLQRVLPRASIVPILMGFRSRHNVEILANLLSRALDNPKVLLVASTDLSHYHPRHVARELDGRITDLVRAFAPTSLWQELREGRVEACGGDPMVSVMLGAAIAGAEASVVLRYADSGDTTGDMQSVVGYLSAAFYRGAPPQRIEFAAHAEELTPLEQESLLHLAYESARTPEGDTLPVMEMRTFTPRLLAPGRAFVTLHRGEELRGCIGFMEARRPLWETVCEAARAAASRDPRFPPVTPGEMREITVEVSLLTEPRPLDPERVVPGRHGVVVTQGAFRGVLLPHLASERGWDREMLLDNACRKAGLPRDAWKKDATVEVFESVILVAEPGSLAVNGES